MSTEKYITTERAIEIFGAMRLHFISDSYDYAKYNGRIRPSKEKNKFYWQFTNVTKGRTNLSYLQQLYTAFRRNNFKFLTEMAFFNHARKSNSKEFESLIEKVQEELSTLDYGKADEIIEGDLYPAIFNMYKEGTIAIETLLVYNRLASKVLERSRSTDIIAWPIELKKLEKVASVFFSVLSKDQMDSLLVSVKKHASPTIKP